MVSGRSSGRVVSHSAPWLIMSAICTASSDFPTLVSAKSMHISCSNHRGPQSLRCIPEAMASIHHSRPETMRVTDAFPLAASLTDCALRAEAPATAGLPPGATAAPSSAAPQARASLSGARLGSSSVNPSITDEICRLSPLLSERAALIENFGKSLIFIGIMSLVRRAKVSPAHNAKIIPARRLPTAIMKSIRKENENPGVPPKLSFYHFIIIRRNDNFITFIIPVRNEN